MKLTEVCVIAKSKNIKPGKLSKTEIIRLIQFNEGNFDCFATACGGDCDQKGCIWREDCLSISRKDFN